MALDSIEFALWSLAGLCLGSENKNLYSLTALVPMILACFLNLLEEVPVTGTISYIKRYNECTHLVRH